MTFLKYLRISYKQKLRDNRQNDWQRDLRASALPVDPNSILEGLKYEVHKHFHRLTE